jgi:hypothetical protein
MHGYEYFIVFEDGDYSEAKVEYKGGWNFGEISPVDPFLLEKKKSQIEYSKELMEMSEQDRLHAVVSFKTFSMVQTIAKHNQALSNWIRNNSVKEMYDHNRSTLGEGIFDTIQVVLEEYSHFLMNKKVYLRLNEEIQVRKRLFQILKNRGNAVNLEADLNTIALFLSKERTVPIPAIPVGSQKFKELVWNERKAWFVDLYKDPTGVMRVEQKQINGEKRKLSEVTAEEYTKAEAISNRLKDLVENRTQKLRPEIVIEDNTYTDGHPNYGRPFKGQIYRGMNFQFGGRNAEMGMPEISREMALDFVRKVIMPDYHLTKYRIQDIQEKKSCISHSLSLTNREENRHFFMSWVAGKDFSFGSEMVVTLNSTIHPAWKLIQLFRLKPTQRDGEYSIYELTPEMLMQIIGEAYDSGLHFLDHLTSSENC